MIDRPAIVLEREDSPVGGDAIIADLNNEHPSAIWRSCRSVRVLVVPSSGSAGAREVAGRTDKPSKTGRRSFIRDDAFTQDDEGEVHGWR